eukprot:COSAG06_NODE_52234_length_307_cov_0.572115_1_plen_56_part_01
MRKTIYSILVLVHDSTRILVQSKRKYGMATSKNKEKGHSGTGMVLNGSGSTIHEKA